MTDARATTETLHRLKALGVDLAIDDFGTCDEGQGYFFARPLEATAFAEMLDHSAAPRPHLAAA